MIHIKLPINIFLPVKTDISPEYTLYGKSLIYLNGSLYAIFCKNLGKNGNGTIPPINKSDITLYALDTPLASRKYIVNKCIIIDNAVTSKHANNNEIINIIKLVILLGIDNLYGSGNKNPITNIGIDLKNAATILFAINLI